MNALSTYVTTCRMVFQSEPDDTSAWSRIYELITIFHQTLSCSICYKLLVIPMSSKHSECQHLYCKACLTKKTKANQCCNLCKSRNDLVENTHYRILLQCHKKLCEYIISMFLHKKWSNINGDANNSFLDLIQEGANLRDDYRYSETHSTSNLHSSEITFGTKNNIFSRNNQVTLISNGETVNSTAPNGILNKSISNQSLDLLLQTNTSNNDFIENNSNVTNLLSEPPSKRNKVANSNNIKIETVNSSNSKVDNKTRTDVLKLKKRGCRCGVTSSHSRRTSCVGQRCQCYTSNLACDECRCKGCKNPIKTKAEENTKDKTLSRKVFFNSLELKQEDGSNSND